MKSIANKILVLTLSTMFVIIIIFSFVSYKFSEEKINSLYDQIINKGTGLWRAEFSGYFKQKEVAIDTVKHVIEKRFTLQELSEPNLLADEFEYLSQIMSSIVQSMNYLNIYAWFHPDFTSPELMMLSVRNYNLDGKITIVNDNTYTTADMTGSEWDWFNITWEKGHNLSDPFEWEGYDKTICSLTNSIYVEGLKVGVIGSDYYIDELEHMMLAQPFMENGHYALLNSSLVFIVNPRHSLQLWKDVYPEDFERTSKILLDSSKKSGVFMSGNQKIGYSRLENGWIVLAVPDMYEMEKDLKRLSAVYFLITVIILCFVIILSLVIARNISKPIIYASNFSVSIIEGGLNTKIAEDLVKRKDEIGTLCRSLEVMRESLKEELEMLKLESEKSTFLFQELYHRTKNNLQLILSLISLELYSETGIDSEKSLELVKNRIHILSIVQDLIYIDDDLPEVRVKDFLIEIISLMERVYGLHSKKIEILIQADSMFINKQNMLPVGFLINEIFVNILAQVHGNYGIKRITIDFYSTEDEVFMVISVDIKNKQNIIHDEKKYNTDIIRTISEEQLFGKFRMIFDAGITYLFEFNKL